MNKEVRPPTDVTTIRKEAVKKCIKYGVAPQTIHPNLIDNVYEYTFDDFGFRSIKKIEFKDIKAKSLIAFGRNVAKEFLIHVEDVVSFEDTGTVAVVSQGEDSKIHVRCVVDCRPQYYSEIESNGTMDIARKINAMTDKQRKVLYNVMEAIIYIMEE